VVDRTVEGRLRLTVPEVGRALRIDGVVTDADLARAGARIFAVLDTISISQGGARCAFAPGEATLEFPDGLALTGRWTCPGRIDRLDVRVGFLEALPRGHTHMAKVVVRERVHERIARLGSESFAVEGPPTLRAHVARLLALGVEHIFTGYDHLAFLLGLLLLGGTLRELVKVVTSFTVAHSVTLAVATVGALAPPARVVEPLIAASIVFVAAENLWALRRAASPWSRTAATRRRWVVTFGFGLVHGFGFASALRELELPRSRLAASLVAFNLGVEAGQVAVVAAALPLLALLRRSVTSAPYAARAASAAIGALGLFWLVQRAAFAG
jgi:hypothetical protein